MLTVFVWALSAALALLLLPVRVSFDAVRDRQPVFNFRVAWLFGLVQWRFTAPKTRPRKTRDTTKRQARGARSRAKGAAFLRTSGVAPRLRRLLSDLLTSLRPKVEWLRIELGLADPADTGQAWAILGPVSAWLMYRYAGLISVEPNFTEPTVVVEGQGQLTVVPLQTLGILLGFLASPSVIRGLYGAQRRNVR